jgi:hypothetical protein
VPTYDHDVSQLRYARSNAPLAAEIDDEIVMLDPATSRYFGLADTGARIWELLADPHTIDELVGRLTSEYDVDDTTCRTQVARFIETLDAAGLVHTAPA